ncbi:MAG: zinc ribbon domain-containing protein [Erysipelotrichaceae bacterium]|nr:zinc ribbon domain-containing protein [Erysipelotrichaceae bacterium]
MEEFEEVSFDDEVKEETEQTREKEVKVIRKISRKKETSSAEETQVYEEVPVEEAAKEETPVTENEAQEEEPETKAQETKEIPEGNTEEVNKASVEVESEKVIEAEEEKDCPYCGKKIPVIARHCPYCGKALFEKDKAEAGKKKKLILAAAAAVLVLAFLLFVMPEIKKANSYKGAISKLHEGNYQEARADFEALEDYKEAKSYVTYCMALDSFNKGDLDKARTRFDNSGELEDAKRYYNYICALQEINGDKGEKDYTEAKKYFDQTEGLLNSEDLSKYCEGISLYLLGRGEEAVPILKEVTNSTAIDESFLESAKGVVTFLNARQLFDKEDYSGLEDFRSLSNMDNELFSLDAADYVNYIEGKQFYDQELFYSAYQRFSKCRSLKDASELADSCFQERPSSGVIYRDTTSRSVSVTIYDTSDGDDMFVKIYDENDKLVETLYIRDGSSATASFQGGKFRMALAMGDSEWWFGTNEAFGGYGVYQRLLLNGNNEYYSFPSGNSYTLKFNVRDGNVDHKSSNYGDF